MLDRALFSGSCCNCPCFGRPFYNGLCYDRPVFGSLNHDLPGLGRRMGSYLSVPVRMRRCLSLTLSDAGIARRILLRSLRNRSLLICMRSRIVPSTLNGRGVPGRVIYLYLFLSLMSRLSIPLHFSGGGVIVALRRCWLLVGHFLTLWFL